MNNKTKMLIIIGFWLFLALFAVMQNEKVFFAGDEILLKVQPVDPRDFLRGQYVQLKYDIGTIPVKKSEHFAHKEAIYVTLKKEGKFYSAKKISKNAPKILGAEEKYIKGRIDFILYSSRYGKDYNDIRIVYGIENFFTKESEAKAIEKSLAAGGIAKIKLDKKGRAKIIGVEQ